MEGFGTAWWYRPVISSTRNGGFSPTRFRGSGFRWRGAMPALAERRADCALAAHFPGVSGPMMARKGDHHARQRRSAAPATATAALSIGDYLKKILCARVC